MSPHETDVLKRISSILDAKWPRRYRCLERKNSGYSLINKPVDLHIVRTEDLEKPRTIDDLIRGEWDLGLVAVEVSNVNTTQLVGEAARLLLDACPRKLLVLCRGNTPDDGAEVARKVFVAFRREGDLTPEVVWSHDQPALERAILGFLTPLEPVTKA